MSGSEEEFPVPPDETEPVEEGDRPAADVPVKGDQTEAVPLSASRDEGTRLNLSDEAEKKR
jgi:hypothetical protein